MSGLFLAAIGAVNIDKVLGFVVLISSIIVAASLWHHDAYLAIMVGVGQLHGHLQHHAHGAGEEGGHLVAHKKVL